ncbi:MAG: PAS domain S-box protein, partial [bacterium]|nr:PAS domain S-box protein [bacterium]
NLARTFNYMAESLKEAFNLRDQTEMALRESEENLSITLNSIGDAVISTDIQGIITRMNPVAENLTGWKVEDAQGKSITEVFNIVNSKTNEKVVDPVSQVLEHGKIVGLANHTMLISQDGNQYQIADSAAPIKDAGGKIAGVVLVFRDVTEEYRMQETLQREKVLSEKYINSLPGLFYVFDEQRFIRWNNEWERITGYSDQELASKYGTDFFNGEDKTAIEERMLKVFREGAADTEAELVTKDGRRIPYYFTGQRKKLNGKDHLVGLGIDITKRVQAEEERKKIEDQLMQSHKMEAIGTLAGGIAHEFNNALSSIMGNIDLLKMDLPYNENIDSYTKQMKDSSDQMTKLTAQLLAYARGGKYQAKTILINELVKDTLSILQHTINHSIKVETNLATENLNVKADPTQMQMLLSAILANASEAIEGKGFMQINTKRKEIDECVKHYPDLKPGPYVCITIEDDGKGMDKETKDKLFEPFFTTKFQGRGLGMAAAYGIVKNHEGLIYVYSEEEKGTVVRIYLPTVEIEVKEPKKPKVASHKGTGTILIIEDDETVMDVNRSLLEMMGYHVLGAMTGEEAVNIANNFDGDINLAILDIILTDMEGGMVYPLIMKARPNLKVIVCSGYSINGPAQDILDAGAEEFIQKPLTLAELSEIVKRVLEGKQKISG